MALRCSCLRLRVATAAPFRAVPTLTATRRRRLSSAPPPHPPASPTPSPTAANNGRALQRLLDGGDGAAARKMLEGLIEQDSATASNVAAVLRRGCSGGAEEVAAVEARLSEAARGAQAQLLHATYLRHRDFGAASRSLAHGVTSGEISATAASKLAVLAITTRMKGAPNAQRAYLGALSRSGLAPMPHAFAQLFKASAGTGQLSRAARQAEEAGALQPTVAEAEVALLALHHAWVRLNDGQKAAAALTQAVLVVDEDRAAAAAMNAVVQLLRPLPVGQKGPGRRRRWQQAIAYLRELAAPPWVTDAHFHPLATACASEEEVLELLTLMERLGVEATDGTFGALQTVGLRLGDGATTAQALVAAVRSGVLQPEAGGAIATAALTAALRRRRRADGAVSAVAAAWEYHAALCAAASPQQGDGPRVKLPCAFFNALLGVAWRGADVASLLGSMAEACVGPDQSTYISLHAALIRLGEIEAAAAALAEGANSGSWAMGDGAAATATLTLQEMLSAPPEGHAPPPLGSDKARREVAAAVRSALAGADSEPSPDESAVGADDSSAPAKMAVMTAAERGRRDALLYLTELAAAGVAEAQQFTIVAQGYRGAADEAETLQSLREMVEGAGVEGDSVLARALSRRPG